ncbi:MAG: CRISPR-associated protein Csx3 [Leptolyngbyaceae cyanobacterium HOT.MB2.61]|nr:CRISPR-associated protein Csx3 [Leptolyngbyaceae cyanobacterium HOT.MB2.61]
MHQNAQIQLDITSLQTGSLQAQILLITLLKPGDLSLSREPEAGNPFFNHIKPAELETLQLPSQLDLSQGIILYGNAPIWLYAHLVNQCRQVPWVASYDIRQNTAIVVKSSTPLPAVGDKIPMPQRPQPGIAIAIGGPPDSGKSILSNALRFTLPRHYPNLNLFLHRANWDGEGNWSYETSDRQKVQTLIERGEYKIHKLPNANALINSYFDYHAKAIENIRKVVDLAIVDLGGQPEAQKLPVIQQCTHYLIISSQPAQIPKWHELFGRYLKPLAVLHSKAAPDLQRPSHSDFLEQTIDLQNLIQTQQIPAELLRAIAQILPTTG